MQNRSRILIVDDDPAIIEAVKAALQSQQYETLEAYNGREALEMYEKFKPDLILLDMRMPIMSGWEFSRVFYNHYGREVPIVVMTAAEDSRSRAKEIGADGYLGKPFNPKELYEVVHDALG